MNPDTDWAPVRVVIATQAEFSTCLEIRTRVFVDEQGVPPELEEDIHDRTATHWLALSTEGPVGTARSRRLGEDAKAERVAVEQRFRRRGVGQALMEAIESWARQQHLEHLQLNAQLTALPFYRRLGYQAEGAIFQDAGIPHRRLIKSLKPNRED